MDRQEALRRAFLAGHAWAADPTLSLADTQKLDWNHPTARKIWKSWRESDSNFDRLLQVKHGARRALADDTWGPATESLVEMQRCPIPDHAPPENADLSGLDEESAGIMRTYQEWMAAGQGSWPSCKPGYQGDHSIRINLDMRNAASHWKRDIDHVIADSVKAYAEFGLRVFYVIDGDPDESEISKKFESIPGGVIGWNEFPKPGTCNQVISGRLDNDYSASAHMKAVLEVHETGHGVGLQHTRGGIMNPTILAIEPLTFRGDPHESTMRRYFGGQPIDIDDPVDPPTPSPPTNAPIIEDLVVHHNGRTLVYELRLKGDDDSPVPPHFGA